MNHQDHSALAPSAPGIDNEKLLQVMFELASEVWVLRDRLSVLEGALVDRQLLGPGQLDAPVTDAALKKSLGDDRGLFISRLLAAASSTLPGQ